MVVAARLENSLLRPSAAAAAVAFHTFALTEYPSINFLPAAKPRRSMDGKW